MRAMKSGKAQGQSRLLRIITIPIRALGKARDLYVRGMNTAERRGYGSGMGGPAGPLSALPKSFSTRPSRSGDSDRDRDDYAELVRAASARAYGARIDVDAILREQLAQSNSAAATAAAAEAKRLPKCSSVGMGKIDEDKPCDFAGDSFGANKRANKPGLLYPRSRSYAVAKRSVVF